MPPKPDNAQSRSPRVDKSFVTRLLPGAATAARDGRAAARARESSSEIPSNSQSRQSSTAQQTALAQTKSAPAITPPIVQETPPSSTEAASSSPKPQQSPSHKRQTAPQNLDSQAPPASAAKGKTFAQAAATRAPPPLSSKNQDASLLPIFKFNLASALPHKGRTLDAGTMDAMDQAEQESRRQELKFAAKSRFINDSSSASSSQSLYEGPTVDFKWFATHAVKLFIALQCLDQDATPDAISLSPLAAETAIHRAIERSMADDTFFDAFFTERPKKGKALRVPISVHANQYDLNDIYAMICPPQGLECPELIPQLLKIVAYFPVTYSKGFSPTANGMLWRVTLSQTTPLHEDTILSFEFVVKWNASRIRDQLLVWQILVDTFRKRYSIDLNLKCFHVDAPLRMFNARSHQQHTEHSSAFVPTFRITYEGQSSTDLAAQLKIIGQIHHTTTRIPPSTDSRCPDGFEFKVACPLLDPSEPNRPLWTKAVITELIAIADASAASIDVVIKHHLAKIAPPCGLSEQSLFEIVTENAPGTAFDSFSSTISNLLSDHILVPNHSLPGLLKLNPARAQMKEIQLVLPNTYVIRAKERDTSIWIDATFGAPAELPPIKFACWYLTAALSFNAFSKDPKEKITPFELWRYAQAQASRMDAFLKIIVKSEYQKLRLDFVARQTRADDGENIVNEEPNPAFFIEPGLISEIVESAEPNNAVNLLAAPFLFPPSFKRFHWLYLRATRRDEDRAQLQNCFLFKSRQANAPTITTLCSGDAGGCHYTQINLQPHQIAEIKEKLGKRNGSLMLYSTLNDDSQHWEYAQHLFEEVDLKTFLKDEAWKMQPKPFPPPDFDLELPPPPPAVDISDDSEGEEQDAETHKQLTDLHARILRLAENADEYSLFPHRADLAKSQKSSAQTRLNSIADEISSLAKQSAAALKPSSSDTTRSLASTIQQLASSQIPIIRKLISNIATVARKGKLSVAAADPSHAIQHFLLRIKSSFRADSALEYLKFSKESDKWTLLDSFEIDFMPYSQNSLHMSIAMAAQHARLVYSALPSQVGEVQQDGTLLDGTENFGVLPQLAPYLPPSKQKAVLLQSFVRNEYPKLAHHPIAPGKLTFAEYLERKGGNPNNYSEMPSDHVLCETALIARACCLNIAVLWHVKGLWKTFLLPHGTQTNIVLVVLYTNMGVEQSAANKDSKARFQPCESPCNRFFPLYPSNSGWIKNPIFKPTTPQSQNPQTTASIISKLGHFDKRRNKQSLLSATVEVSGSECSADEASEATADVSYQQWMAGGFIDDDFVDQTPPSEFALEQQTTATAAINELNLECILEVFRRKIHPRVDDSDLDELLNLGSEAGAQGAL